MSELFDCRKAFSEALIALATDDSRVVVVANDSIGSSNLKEFQKRFPERLINVGIAEQNMVGVGVGLSHAGKIPFVCGASCFLTGRAMEQIKVDVAYSQSNVKLCAMSSGVAYGELGPTHHSIEDFAWMRVIASMTVIAPADPIETTQAVRVSAAFQGPVFLRLSRMPVPVVHDSSYQFQIGQAKRLRRGSDVTLVANGTMVSRALEAADLLQRDGFEATVLNVATVQPLDEKAIIEAAKNGPIVTVEEHSIRGGLGSAVAEIVVRHRPVAMRVLGIPGEFAPTGSAQFIFEHYGLTPKGIYTAARQILEETICGSGSETVPSR